MIKDYLYSKFDFIFSTNFKTAFFYLLLFLLSAAIAVKSVNYDFDLWARLIAGMAVVQTGQVLKYDFLSYTPTHPWYDHEWGSSVVFYLFEHYLGHTGLLILQILLIFLTMFFLVKTVKVRCAENCDYKNILIYFIILNCFTVTYSSLIRCHSFTFLFFIIELYILELIRKNGNYKLLMIFPPMFLIWGNMHGGVVSGLGLLVMYTIGEALNKKTFKYYLITAIICPLMLFINPYGIEFVKFLIKAVTMPRHHVVEWWHIFTKYNYNLFLSFKFMALFYIIIEALKCKNNFSYKASDKTKIIVLLVTLFLAVKHVKMMPFFALTGTVFCYEDVLNFFKKYTFPKWGMPSLVTFLTFFAVVSLAIKDYRPMVNFKAYPIMEVEFLRINHIEGKLLTNFGIGSFASYKLYPQNKIYMDGRYEEVYEDYLLEDLSKFYTMQNGALNIFLNNKPDIIILENSYKSAYDFLKNNISEWRVVFEGMYYGVFVNKKIARDNYIPPSGDLKYYKKTILNTMITFKGPNRIKIEEINNRGKVSE